MKCIRGTLACRGADEPSRDAKYRRLFPHFTRKNRYCSFTSPLWTMGNVNGAYMEILERSKNSVTGILEHSSFPHFLAGLSAGIMECLVGHPLDTIRIGIMVSPGESPGPLAILKQLVHGFSSFEGLIEIYRGVNSELLSAALGGALLFGVNELLKSTLHDIDARRRKRLEEETGPPSSH